MPQIDLDRLIGDFHKNYDAESKDSIWAAQSKIFRDFWSKKVIDGQGGSIPEEDIDEIIRILDRNGKGNTKGSESVARAMIAQGAWRRMFNELSVNKKLAAVITSVFEESDLRKKRQWVDQLYKLNEGKKNSLTGQSGNAINAMLAAYDPVNNITVISINERIRIIKFFGLEWTFDIEHSSPGQRIIDTNKIILEGLTLKGLRGSGRTISCFFYHPPVRSLWKDEHTIKRADKQVAVSVPVDLESDQDEEAGHDDVRESIQMQALLADIGSRMGMKIWLPKSDRARVSKQWKDSKGVLLDTLPLNYDDTTLRTIEQIDVLWLQGRFIVRAFEVEHTTSIYSGILRMADLHALQPNMAINLHIVAPSSKREKVFQEIRRPVFSLLDRAPLADMCTYLSYDNLKVLSAVKHLEHLSDKVLDEYTEEAE